VWAQVRAGRIPHVQLGRYRRFREEALDQWLDELELYRKRQPMIEPVFGHTKFNRRIDRFHRRGRHAARTEWKLITATHNLLKLYRHSLAPIPA
jgi:hypothetical protein